MRVLGIAGSLRRDSHNRRLLRSAAALLPPGVEFVELDGLAGLPPYNEDDEAGAEHDAVAALRGAIADADAVLFATPEYNGSIPGQLKNAVDWASRPARGGALQGKPAAVIGGSTGMFGAVWAQAELRRVLGIAGARVVDRELPVPAIDEAFDADGALLERELTSELDGILGDLLSSARERAELLA
jgi:chromate reductase